MSDNENFNDRYLEQHRLNVDICPQCKGPVESHLLYPNQTCPTVLISTGPIASKISGGKIEYQFLDEMTPWNSTISSKEFQDLQDTVAKGLHAWASDEFGNTKLVPQPATASVTGINVPPGMNPRAQAADPDDSLDILPYSNNFDCPKCGRQVDDITFNDDSENGEFLVCECPCNITHYRRCRDYKA